ncbi:hypothetical protein LQ327_24680 [Actinomycetospora endophytica]|uniref:Uncharacterized protein n=1 Tax=Actinomycetospora endophytica TaxID=2291215 RepID=A0ABS8PEY9_9PSEU|nr:hypothetical protein [Actinomycetospora endophytica]MCD2196573.1 hypothetical protein [Actinomycetospora endophytica]
MREFAVRYVNGPLQGEGSISVPDDAPGEPPLVQRIPLPATERGVQQTMSRMVGGQSHAVYERTSLNDAEEWEFQLVRIE